MATSFVGVTLPRSEQETSITSSVITLDSNVGELHIRATQAGTVTLGGGDAVPYDADTWFHPWDLAANGASRNYTVTVALGSSGDLNMIAKPRK